MTDFPVSNANPDAMFIIGLIRCMGIEPYQEGGLLVNLTRVWNVKDILPVSLQTPLISATVNSTGLFGMYHAWNDGLVKLHCVEPKGQKMTVINLEFKRGQKVPFQVMF